MIKTSKVISSNSNRSSYHAQLSIFRKISPCLDALNENELLWDNTLEWRGFRATLSDEIV